jgi:hypothetical protein
MNSHTFTAHSQVVPLRGILPPRKVTVWPRRVTTNREQQDALADDMLARERQRNMDAVSEETTEARAYPRRIDRDND